MASAVVDPDHLESASLELAFQAAALRVTGRGEPAGDVPKVQQAMVGPECLDASRFPIIRFASRAVTVKARSGDAFDVVVRGDLTLHGVSREVPVPSTSSSARMESARPAPRRSGRRRSGLNRSRWRAW